MVTSDTATAINTAPVLGGATLSKTNPAEGDTLSVNLAGAFDADGDPITYAYQWLVNGAPVATTSTLDSALFAKGDTIVVEVTPNDGLTDGLTITSGPATAINTAPVLGAAALSKTDPAEGDTLSVSLTGAVDADGDPITYAYQWLVNGSPVATTSTLGSALFKKGDTVVVKVTPNDGTVNGATVTSNTATVINTAPVLGSATLSKTNPAEGDTLSVSLTGAVDADGDPITYAYQWLVNGSPVATTSTLGSALFKKGDTVVVQVTPNDGTVNGATVTSNTATVANSAPVMVSAVIAPSAPDTNSLLSVSLSSTDADADAVTYTYSWKVNGSAVGSASTLAGTSFIKHDVITVIVTPNDGTVNGAPLTSASVTVLNTAPTAPGLTMSPVSPRTANNIACLISTPSTDLDGDALGYIFSWTVNGSPYAGPTLTTARAGDTIPSAQTTDGQIWKCTAVANDGETNGPAGTATATVIDAFKFTDTTGDDIATTALRDYFNSLTITSSDFIYFEVRGGGSQGAWCSERADWYASNYVALAGANTYLTSGAWNKYYNPGFGGWSGATTTGYGNYFGSNCDGTAWSWCSEWGLGGEYLAIMPGRPSSPGESYASGWSSGANWTLTINVGPNRLAACGF